MILKEKKLSIVMALILGTTMLSSVEKAWGMDDENDLIKKRFAHASSSTSSSTSSSFDAKSLTGDLLVRGSYVRLDKDFVQERYDSTMTPKNIAAPQGALNKKFLEQLLNGNFARVAASVRSASPKFKAHEVLKASLKIILDDSQADPYDQLILAKSNELYSPSVEEVTNLKSHFRSLSRPHLLDFLTTNLEHVIKDTPDIVGSLSAHLPKTLQEKEEEDRAIQSLVNYFIKPELRKSLRINGINDEMCLTNLAERYALLAQIEQSLRAPVLPQPSALDPSAPSSSDPAPSMPSVKVTFRTAGENPSAKNKHSAVSVQLSNQDLLGDAYGLIINHRTGEEGPIVRIYDPITRTYKELGTLSRSLGFGDEFFDITDWAKAVRDDSSPTTEVKTYLSFMNGKSHIHSFKIQSMGTVLKEIVLGDAASESQAGVHVYGPETDRDANEWSAMQSEDLSE